MKLRSTILAFSVMALVGSVNAAPLTIKNDTQNYSTCIINRGACSTILGESGITKPFSTNVIAERTLKFACLLNMKECEAAVYMTNDCTGPKVATVNIDVKTGKGIYRVVMHDPHYKISTLPNNRFFVHLETTNPSQ